MPGTILSGASGTVFGPTGSPGTVPGTVTRIELGKHGGTTAIFNAGITDVASTQVDAASDDMSLRSAEAEAGGTERGAAGVGTEVETTTVDTMGPGDLAEVSDRPLLQAVRSATPTPAAPPPGTGTPQPAEGPRETNNSTLRPQHWYKCNHSLTENMRWCIIWQQQSISAIGIKCTHNAVTLPKNIHYTPYFNA